MVELPLIRSAATQSAPYPGKAGAAVGIAHALAPDEHHQSARALGWLLLLGSVSVGPLEVPGLDDEGASASAFS